MARQLGHVKYKGTIGDIRHFKIKGMTGNFAGMNGGATGEQIKSGASFVRTRENMNEFAGCASVGKAIRAGQSQLMKTMSDPQLTGRLTGIVKKINLEDQTEARGYRAILVSTQEAKWLKINKAEPCLLIRRRTWSNKNLISSARLIYPGHRYHLEGKFTP